MKTLIIFAFVCFFADAEVDPCTFNAQEACDRCPFDRNWIQYVADGCHNNTFWFCEKTDDGNIIPHNMSCDPCHNFSNADWSCSLQMKNLSYCPSNDSEPIYPIPTLSPQPDFFCLDWDKDWRETVYYDQQSSCKVNYVGNWYPPNDPLDTGLHTSNNGLVFHGSPCNVEVPYFQNNQFRQFTMCGMFNWFNPNVPMGLVFNGYIDDCYPGSISIMKDANNRIVASLQMESGFRVSLSNPTYVAPVQWHEVCLRFNGEVGTLELSVDHIAVQISRPIKLKGLTRQMHCNLRLGEVVERYPDRNNSLPFHGAMDDWCFIPAIVPDSYFRPEGN